MEQEIKKGIKLNFSDIEKKLKVARETKILQFTNKKVQVTYSLN